VDSGLQPNWQAVESAARLLLELSRTRYRKQHGPLRIHITGEVDRLCAGRNRHEKGTVGKRRRLVMRDGQGCVWCDKDLLPSAPDCTIEHIIPRVYGGKNLLENTACACLNCNSRRSARGVAAWTVDCELRGLHPRKDVLISLLQTLALREDASGRAARRELLAFENAEQPTLSLLPA
jgi:5-methylcytosine-specific restriction endonuclease McrA